MYFFFYHLDKESFSVLTLNLILCLSAYKQSSVTSQLVIVQYETYSDVETWNLQVARSSPRIDFLEK